MPDLDSFGERYIQLAFRIHQHLDGYVDAYIGNPALRDAVLNQSPLPVGAMLAEADSLLNLLATSDYPARRRIYLHKQLIAMQTACRHIADDKLPYREELRRYFDIDPQPIDNDVFDHAIEELETLLPGHGSVAERMITWRKRFEINGQQAQTVMPMIADELRSRTTALYPLPEGENVEFRMVSNQPWGGFNWYHGNYASGVDINTDLPIAANGLTNLIAHEAYAGHHTEHCIKERDLFYGRGWAEQSIFLVNTPECVIAEGIANLASHVLFADGELARWQAEHVYPRVGIDGDPEREQRINRAGAALAGVRGNAALMLHDEGRSEADVIQYLMRYALISEDRAHKTLSFLNDPLWRAYIFTYFYGEHLLDAWMQRGDKVERFGTLLHEQIYPSLIEQWIFDERSSCGVGRS